MVHVRQFEIRKTNVKKATYKRDHFEDNSYEHRPGKNHNENNNRDIINFTNNNLLLLQIYKTKDKQTHRGFRSVTIAIP